MRVIATTAKQIRHHAMVYWLRYGIEKFNYFAADDKFYDRTT